MLCIKLNFQIQPTLPTDHAVNAEEKSSHTKPLGNSGPILGQVPQIAINPFHSTEDMRLGTINIHYLQVTWGKKLRAMYKNDLWYACFLTHDRQ